MARRLGNLLRQKRGATSRLSFARTLQLSYTFVRSLEEGVRFPSDEVLRAIAERLDLDENELVLAAYCDRSEALTRALRGRGLDVQDVGRAPEPPAPLPGDAEARSKKASPLAEEGDETFQQFSS